MLTDRQRDALAVIENQFGAQDPALAKALDTLTAPATVPRLRRCARWVFLSCVAIAPLLMVGALAMIPLPIGPIAVALLTITACAHVVARRRAARARRLRHPHGYRL